MGANDAVRKTSVDVAPFGGRLWRRGRARQTADRASRTNGPARKYHSPDATAQHQPAPRYGAGAIATVSAVLVYFLATTSEIAVIERVRPGEMELTWVSDAAALSRDDWQDDRTVVAFALDTRAVGSPSMVSS